MSDTKNIPFYGTWKGEIIDAIVNHKARVWEDFMEITDIPNNRINRVLKELFAKDALEKNEAGEYRVPKDLWTAYKSLNKKQQQKKVKTAKKQVESLDKEFAKGQIANILANDQESVTKLTSQNSIFVADGKLTSVIEKLVGLSQSMIEIMNPYIGQSRIVDALIQSPNTVQLDVVTRTHGKAMKLFKKDFRQTHKQFTNKKAQIVYNDKVHAKIIIFDGKIAIVSSMNLFMFSQEHSLEAGTIHFDDDVVSEIQEYYWKTKKK